MTRACIHHLWFLLISILPSFPLNFYWSYPPNKIGRDSAQIMGKIQHIHICAFLFTLFTSQVISVDGRQIKPMKTTELNSIENISKTFGKKGISINSCHNEAAQKIDPQQTTSSKVRRMATQQKNFQHRVPTQSSGFNDVDAVHMNGFQPMAPGSSPDVGQLFEGEKTDTMTIAESPDVKWKDDFQPITPGDGPGVSHPFVGHTDNISQTSQTEDNYRPTLPGRSPGVGHLSRKEYKEPNV